MNEIGFLKKKIDAEIWKKLFNLTEQIETTMDFNSLGEFVILAHDSGVVLPDFDWMNWKEGQDLLRSQKDFSELDLDTLFKLITAIVRNEKYCLHFLYQNFSNGKMGQIIRATEEKVHKKDMESQSMNYEKNSTGLAGEYFVAAELYKRGYSVGMTIGNAKSVDLFIQKGEKQLAVQVKTLRTKNCFDLMVDKIKGTYIYAFVILNQIEESPDFFIMQGQEIIENKELLYGKSLMASRQTINYGPLKLYQNRWGKIEGLIGEANSKSSIF